MNFFKTLKEWLFYKPTLEEKARIWEEKCAAQKLEMSEGPLTEEEKLARARFRDAVLRSVEGES